MSSSNLSTGTTIDEKDEEILNSLKSYQRSRPNKKWKNLGSDKEILAERITNHRPLIKMRFSKPRKYFGKLTQHTTTDSSDSYKFCTSVIDPNFTVFKKERDFGVQNVIGNVEKNTQTQRFRKVNKSTQVKTEESYKKDEEFDEFTLLDFLKRVEPKLNKVLKQSAILPIFEDDFASLGKEDSFVGRKSASVLKEYQSFTHIEFTKNKTISSIDWQPNSKGMLAFSCLNAYGFDQYLSNYGKSKTSYVVVWSFADPIYPHVVLKAPCDVCCIKFNPVNTNLIVGGLKNGQVILWDISEEDKTFQFSLKQEASRDHIKTLSWKQISLIELSHKSAVTDITWFPNKNEELDDNKKIKKSEKGEKNQFFTISSDGRIFLWDIRKDHLRKKAKLQKMKNEKLKDAWLPYQTFFLKHLIDFSDVSGVSFAFDKLDIHKLIVTTEEGSLVMCNWGDDGSNNKKKIMSQQQVGEGEVQSRKIGNVKTIVVDTFRTKDGAHFGLSKKIDGHPILKDIYLTVGDWTAKIWKVGNKTPLWTSPYSDSLVSCGLWSPTRPAVVYVGREDGTIEVWDFMDKSYEPSMIFSATQAKITSMSFRQVTSKSKVSVQYVAVGSQLGTLHIISIPLNLIRASKMEESNFLQFLEREEDRVKYYEERWKYHDKKKKKGEKKKVEERKKDEDVYEIDYAEIVKKFQMDLQKYSEDESSILS